MTKFLLLDWMDIQTDGHKNKEINNQSKTKMIREKDWVKTFSTATTPLLGSRSPWCNHLIERHQVIM